MRITRYVLWIKKTGMGVNVFAHDDVRLASTNLLKFNNTTTEPDPLKL
jgi:hypothetical protein